MDTPILLVDDEINFLKSMRRVLHLNQFSNVTCEDDPTQVEKHFTNKKFEIALLDVTMPRINGIELLKKIKDISPQTECVMVTAHTDIQLVVQAMKLGAADYLVKPVQAEQLNEVLRHILMQSKQLAGSGNKPRSKLKKPSAFAGIHTNSRAMLDLLYEAELQAESDIPILITGETGVGKELLAGAIHRASLRCDKPFVAINMMAINESLFEAEVFGHTRGAFTGAVRERKGYLAEANHGTLFFDEIGDLNPDMQGKLLRLLQEKEFVPIGQSQPQQADVRFIAATNRDLQQEVEKGSFRKDLFYRLHYAHLHIPPLRERKADIVCIAQAVLDQLDSEKVLSQSALETLNEYHFPGNVRELKGIIEAAANRAENNVIEKRHLSIAALSRRTQLPECINIPQTTLASAERLHIKNVVRSVGYNKTKAARILDISIPTLYRKIKQYQIH